ncbi:MAG: TetR/AcrR family transcriptional regulator [Pseudomonadota bacterium]
MAPRTAAVPEAELCSDIVEVALNRFLHYGYNKTTMAEIAEDIGMSAANLYRYFDNKQDIAAACCAKSMDESLARLASVSDTDAPLATQLERYVFTMIEYTHELASPESKIGELVAFITRERSEVVRKKLNVHYALITEMLKRSMEKGEIQCSSPVACAEQIYSALVVFDVPLFVGFYSKEEYKKRAAGLVKLLVHGLSTGTKNTLSAPHQGNPNE